MEIQNSELEAEIEKREKLGSCEVCDKIQAKYTCPRCEIHTCSLNCSKIHKKELDCSGSRDKTKYIPLSKMTASDFMNDYYFLEEAARFTKEVKTSKIIKNCKKMNNKSRKLKNAAFKRRKEVKSEQQSKSTTDGDKKTEYKQNDDDDEDIAPKNYFF